MTKLEGLEMVKLEDPEPLLNDFERERLQNLERNKRVLQELNLQGAAQALQTVDQKVKPKRQKKQEEDQQKQPQEPVRRSMRQRGVAAEEVKLEEGESAALAPPKRGSNKAPLIFGVATSEEAAVLNHNLYR